MYRKAWPIAVALAWLVVLPARAQEAPAEVSVAEGAEADPAAISPTAESVIRAAAEKLRPPSIPRACVPSESGVILVCAQDDSGQRVPSSTDQAIANGEPVSDGKPRAPDVLGLPSGGVSIRMGAPPAPVYMIDLKAIPEAPAGSDAARYAEDADESPAAPAAP